ncbi:MAG: haloacid dehalogenase [Armatimonadetes bacterium]|nr:haloacid dehalogenase [Armatimonadota bacterium]
MNRPELEAVAATAREFLDREDAHREGALEFSRQVIRTAATIIKHAHRSEYDEAHNLLAEMGEAVREMNERMQASPSLWFAGFVTDALKEYAEAHQTLRILQGERLPTPEEIGVSPATYLNGLAEAIGEMRRHVLDLIRIGEPERAGAVLDEMDEMYALLMTFDYPEAVSLGLRRRTDAARGLVERTRGDVTNALQQSRLEAKMAQFQARISEG